MLLGVFGASDWLGSITIMCEENSWGKGIKLTSLSLAFEKQLDVIILDFWFYICH